MGLQNVQTLVGEIGPDLTKFRSASAFASWLGLCPANDISGGAVLRTGTRKVNNRAAKALRLAAQTLYNSKTPLGNFYRRMRAKLGGPKAVTAAAHQLARLIFHLVTTGQDYDDTVFAKQQERYRKHQEAKLQRKVSAGGGVGNNPIRTNPDAVAEMKIISSNASAEFGRNSGGQVAMVTKSGTNEIHGNLFWFYRTPRLNANQWEDNLNRIGKQMFVQNIYGGSVGGPIKKNKLFYFANWQELAASRSVSQTAIMLTQEARNGVFRFNPAAQNRPAGVAGAAVDLSGNPVVPVQSYNIVQNDPDRRGFDATVRGLLGSTPLPNRFDAGGDGLNYAAHVFRPTETERQRDLTAKIDYVVSNRNTVFGRIYWGFQNTLCDGVNGGLPRVPGAPCLTDTKRSPRNYAINWRSNPNAVLTNEFVGGYSEFFFDFPIPCRT